MKKLFFLFFLLGFIFVPVYAFASVQKGQGNGSQNGNVNNTVDASEDDDEEDRNSPGDREQERERVQEHKSSTSTPSDRALERRSAVANAVQEMVKVSDRTVRGIGEQVREIAQEQNRNFDEAEERLAKLQKRSKFMRFLVGQDDDVIAELEERLTAYEGKVAEIKALREQLTNTTDKTAITEQLQVLEGLKDELRGLVQEEQKGFSLFGWVKKLFR
ncbi:MAG: hypothetical protein V1848_03880 [Candidatus Magasanikbacteria bacterium]